MGSVSIRIPAELESAFEAYLEEERLDRHAAARALLTTGLYVWQRERCLERFANGTYTVTAAAEETGLSLWEFSAAVADREQSWVSSEHLETDLDAL